LTGFFQTILICAGLSNMLADGNSPIKGQDFEDPNKKNKEKPSSHGEVANQKDGDFSELEESRMEHPPQHRDENGSSQDDVDQTKSDNQNKGVK